MAHFAEISTTNDVIQVIVVADQDCQDENGVEQESIGIEFCQRLLGGIWLQTSYNGRIRKNYAAVGGKYIPEADAFVSPQPFPSWSINNETGQWEPPIPQPDLDGQWIWDEATQTWSR